MPFRLALTVLLLGTAAATAQPAPPTLPAGTSLPGRLLSSSHWRDKLGEHLLLLSVEDSSRHAGTAADSGWTVPAARRQLHAAHFLLGPGAPRRLWLLTAGPDRCALDARADFVEGAPLVTDLDEDDVCEVWLGYKLSCSSSLGPQRMTVRLYRGEQAGIMQGRSLLHQSAKGLDGDPATFEGGDYQLDAGLRRAPKLFREFARAYWAAHALDTHSRALTVPR